MDDTGTGSDDAILDVAMLKTAFQIENHSSEFYSALTKCVRDARTASVLRGLVLDTKKHLRTLMEKLEGFPKALDISEIRPIEEYLEFLDNPDFSISRNVCLTLEGEVKALGKAIEIEKRKMKIYSKELRRAEDPDLRATLEKLQGRVRNHIRQLEDNVRWLRLDGNWYGYVPLLGG